MKNAVVCFLQMFSEGVLNESYEKKSAAAVAANLKRNWYFPVSAMAFFCLSAALNIGYILGMVFAFGFAVFVAAQVPSLWAVSKKYTASLRIFSLISAIGICMSIQSSFYTDLMQSAKTQALKAMLPSTAIDIPALVTAAAAM